MRRLCQEIVVRTPALAHIDLERMLLAFAQTRNRNHFGLYASLTPLRFEGGTLTCRRRGHTYTLQRLFLAEGQEALYILTFYLPRFMDLGFQEKLVTIFHELWHVSPDFDGDLRRHAGRCYAHTHSQKEYDAEMTALARHWLATEPASELYSFLRLSFAELRATFGRVLGTKTRRPRLLPVD
jgi:hypothetical protein